MAGDPKALIALVRDLEEEAALALVRRRLESGEDPLAIMEECQEGVRQVGLLYEERRYFVSALIMAGEILRQVIELLEPSLKPRAVDPVRGVVLLGTVQGDIHDIGKNIVHMLLRCHGITVVDLGVDVSADTFLARAMEVRPAVVALSGLLTTAIDAMKDTVAALRSGWEGPDPVPLVLVGGGVVDEAVCRFVGADEWAGDALGGLRACQRALRGGGG